MDEENEQNEDPKNDIKGLREAADRGREAAKERDAAKRELAFMRAGIDLDEGGKMVKLWANAYEGELTKEAIRAAALEDGLLKAEGDSSAKEEKPPVTREEQHAEQIRQSLATGNHPGNSEELHPVENALRVGEAARRDGADREEAFSYGLNTLLHAAVEGDERVITRGPGRRA